MTDATFFLILKLLTGLIIGAVMGSFFTMLFYRVPRRLSIIAPASSCPACKQPLRPRDLVPIFSYLLNKGSCRMCGTKIGEQYLFIELISACVGGLMAYVFF